jgi:hypothetical protein
VMQALPATQALPARQPAPVTQAQPIGSGVAAAIAGSNLLVLAQDDGYLASLNAQLRAGVASNRRDALDLAGKLPLAIKALAVGISPAELNIDPSQAGGLLGKFDAKITRSAPSHQQAYQRPVVVTSMRTRTAAALKSRAHAATEGARRFSSRVCGPARRLSISCLWRGSGTLRTGQTCASWTRASGWATWRGWTLMRRWRCGRASSGMGWGRPRLCVTRSSARL